MLLSPTILSVSDFSLWNRFSITLAIPSTSSTIPKPHSHLLRSSILYSSSSPLPSLPLILPLLSISLSQSTWTLLEKQTISFVGTILEKERNRSIRRKTSGGGINEDKNTDGCLAESSSRCELRSVPVTPLSAVNISSVPPRFSRIRQ